MGRFDKFAVLRVLPFERDGRGEFELVENFVYRIDDVTTVDVPTGFRTDLASIPRFARMVISPSGKHANAAIIHDYLYYGGFITVNDDREYPTRAQADLIFYDAMKDMNVSWLRRGLMWLAVRVGGGRAWERVHRDKERVLRQRKE